MMQTRNGIPIYRPDVYGTKATVEPYPQYERLRELGIFTAPRCRVRSTPHQARFSAAAESASRE